MKILALSDSHRKTDNLLKAVQTENPDVILHMGDYANDCLILSMHYSDLPLYCVRGNCDGNVDEADELELNLDGKHIFMTHGHRYGVKGNTDSLITKGLCCGSDIVLYGHTHYQTMQHIGDMLAVNPGSVGYDRDYALIEIENGEVKVTLKHLEK